MYYDIKDIVILLGLKTKKCGCGSQVNVVCPVCGKLKLNINFNKNVFNCPVCGTCGNSNTLYTLYTGVEKPFKEICEKLQISTSNPAKLKPRYEQEYKEPEIRDIKERDEVYSALTNILTLQQNHKNNLIERGLTEEYINKKGYVSIPKGQGMACVILLEKLGYDLSKIPGFYKNPDGSYNMVDFYSGFLIPIRDFNNRIQSFQIRNMQVNEKTKNKYVHFSSSSQNGGIGVKSFIHFACEFDNGMPILGEEIVLTEGALKSDIAHFASGGVPFIGVLGVNALSELVNVLPVLKAYGVKKILTAYDMDYLKNIYVQRAEAQLYNMFKDYDFAADKLTWNPSYKGIDDYLVFKNIKKPLLPH